MFLDLGLFGEHESLERLVAEGVEIGQEIFTGCSALLVARKTRRRGR